MLKINRVIKAILLICMPLLFGGCAANIDKVKQNLSSASLCCADYSDVAYHPLKSSQTFQLSDGNQVRQFDGQSSYFQAFKLNGSEVDSIVLHSYIAGTWLPSSHIVIPRVTLLNKEFATIGDKDLDMDWDSDTWLGGFLKATIVIPKDTHYLIVSAVHGGDDSTIDYTNYSNNTVPISTGSGTIYVSTGTTATEFDIPFSPDGMLKIFAEDLDKKAN